MGNNKITNLGNPGSANDAVSKRFLYKRIQNSLMIMALKVFLVILFQLRMRLLGIAIEFIE